MGAASGPGPATRTTAPLRSTAGAGGFMASAIPARRVVVALRRIRVVGPGERGPPLNEFGPPGGGPVRRCELVVAQRAAAERACGPVADAIGVPQPQALLTNEAHVVCLLSRRRRGQRPASASPPDIQGIGSAAGNFRRGPRRPPTARPRTPRAAGPERSARSAAAPLPCPRRPSAGGHRAW